MKILDGKKIAEEILTALRDNIKKDNLRPGLAVILIGNDEASRIYVNLKEKEAKKVGINFQKFEFSEDTTEDLVLEKIGKLNKDESINGIIVQLPLPNHLDKNKIIRMIDPQKDVDGFHPENISRFFGEKETIIPVLPKAILALLKAAETNPNNMDAIVICNSVEFGQAMKFALEKNGVFADYVLQNEIMLNSEKIKNKNIVITACGIPGLVKGNMVKEGAIVIDAGITRAGKKVVGDADFETIKDRVAYITPVPGGVGPVTIACLLENVYLASKKSR